MAEQRPVGMSRRAGPAGARPTTVPPMTPKEMMSVFSRHMGKIIFLTIVGCVLGGVSWFGLYKYLPKYTAQTYVEILSPAENDPTTIGTAMLNKDILYGYRLSMASLIKQQRTLEELIRLDTIKRTNWFKDKDDSTRKAVRDLQKNLGAFALRDGGYVQVSMTCGNKEEAALIVNEMVNLFVATQTGTKKQEVGDKLARLQEQLVRVQRDVDDADKSLDDVRKAWNLTDLDQSAGRYWRHTITVRLEDLELEQNDLKLALRQLAADITNLERIATGPITVQIEYAIERDPVVQLLTQNLAFQEASLKGRMSRFGENHREIRMISDQLDQIKEEKLARELEIAEEMRRSNLANARDGLLVLTERYTQLEQLREEAKAQKRDLDMARVQFEQRATTRDERITMLDSIKEQIEKLKIMLDDPETPKVRAMGLAPAPLDQVFTRQWWVHFPSGTLLGFLFGTALAFLLEMMDDTVRKPRDIARYLHIPLLGVIPDSASDRQLRGVELAQVVQQAPGSIVSESYRRCRANIELSASGDTTSVLVAGGMAGDGATSVAANLASTFIAEGKNVLLIDANFRRPSLQGLFPGARGDAGLSTLLMGQCTVKQAVRSSGLSGLDIIDAGPMPANPAEILASAKMNATLNDLAKTYDRIVIDGPPVLLVSDAKLIAGAVDATILVVNAESKRGAAQRAASEMQAVGANLVGCILFGAEPMKGGYFNEQYKSYRKYAKVQIGAPAPMAAAVAPEAPELELPED